MRVLQQDCNSVPCHCATGAQYAYHEKLSSLAARRHVSSRNGARGVLAFLVDGRELASLMVDCGLGVSEERVYRTYRIDSDFFEEEELLFGLDHQGRSVAAHAAAIMNAPSS